MTFKNCTNTDGFSHFKVLTNFSDDGDDDFPEDRILYTSDKELVPTLILIAYGFLFVGLVGYTLLLFTLFSDPQYSRSASFHLHKTVAIVDVIIMLFAAYFLVRKFYWLRNKYELCTTNALHDLVALAISKEE